MDQHLDKAILAIIILLLILIIGLIVVAIFLALNYFKKSSVSTDLTNEKKNDSSEVSFLEGTGLCVTHDDKPSVGICAICEDEYCVECLKQIDSVNLCPEHFNTFANNTWKSITNQRTTPNSPEDGIYIYKFKRQLWNDRNIPTYIVNEYKIEVENDFIETYVQLNVIEESSIALAQELEEFKRKVKNV
ncbi:hypothetical protein A9Q84_21140 [Halobacteriovorax marinus]|uniref:Uncharacterized protein n=1 Tax=Halobacteriovorax marinus TaxID=97084 RepID=A0A1Y5F7B7_9BACT|nr:hypothetical protein A9Q84_21140 [Halobacteriovorax marinus]